MIKVFRNILPYGITSSISMLLGTIVAFMPKCMFCWAAYASLLSSIGISSLSFVPWLMPAILVLFTLNAFAIVKMSIDRNVSLQIILNIAGVCLMLINRFLWDLKIFIYIGLALMVISSTWQLISGKKICNYSLKTP